MYKIDSFQKINEYFDLETKSDQIWFYSCYSTLIASGVLASIIGLLSL